MKNSGVSYSMFSTKFSFLLKRFFGAILLIILQISLFGCNFPQTAQELDSTPQKILGSETNPYTIDDAFLPYYQSLKSPAFLIGQANSLAFIDPESGNLVQYFQKARLEQQQGSNGKKTIAVTPLGSFFMQQAQGQQVAIDSHCIIYPDTDFPICGAFLTFYETNETAYIGKPISNIYLSDDRFIQYYDNVMLVWNPQAPSQYQVTVANLGELYLSSYEPQHKEITIAENPALMIPEMSNSSDIRVEVSFDHPFIQHTHPQTIFIQAFTPENTPLQGADVLVTVFFPAQPPYTLRPGSTDENGILSFTFQIPETQSVQWKDEIVVNVLVEAHGQTGQGSGSFRILP